MEKAMFQMGKMCLLRSPAQVGPLAAGRRGTRSTTRPPLALLAWGSVCAAPPASAHCLLVAVDPLAESSTFRGFSAKTNLISTQKVKVQKIQPNSSPGLCFATSDTRRTER